MGIAWMKDDAPRVAVIGGGFIGPVHVEALRRIGIEVVGLLGSSPDRARRRGRSPGDPARVRRSRRPAGRPGGRFGPHRLAQCAPLRAGATGPGVGPARRLRKAARDHLGRDLGPACAGRGEAPAGVRGELQRPLLPALLRDARSRRAGRSGADPQHQRLVHAGLAPPARRLQLAGRARRRDEPPRGRRHRDALDGPGAVRAGPADPLRPGRPGDVPSRAAPPGRTLRDVHGTRSIGGDPGRPHHDRGPCRGPLASGRRGARGLPRLAGDRRPEEPALARSRRDRRVDELGQRVAEPALDRPPQRPELPPRARPRPALPLGPRREPLPGRSRRGLPRYVQGAGPRGLRLDRLGRGPAARIPHIRRRGPRGPALRGGRAECNKGQWVDVSP